MNRWVRLFTDNEAATSPDGEDRALRSRTYAVPFEHVWQTVQAVADGRGWTVLDADDLAGTLRLVARTPVFRFIDDVEVRVTLDRDAQTQVDLTSKSRVGNADLGTNRRRIVRFLRRLDRELATYRATVPEAFGAAMPDDGPPTRR